MPRIALFVLSLALAALSLPAHAAFTLSAGGTPVAGEGEYSSVAGALTTTFNSGLLPPGYAGGTVVTGSSGLTAAPPGDTSFYYTVGPSWTTPGIVSLASLSSYFGFYMGSPDTYNALELWNGANLLKTYTGADFAALIATSADGNRDKGLYVNIFAGTSGDWFNGVRFISPTNAFETDNHAVLAVPEPGITALFAAGLALLGFAARRRSA